MGECCGMHSVYVLAKALLMAGTSSGSVFELVGRPGVKNIAMLLVI